MNLLPSAAVSVMSPWSAAAPEIGCRGGRGVYAGERLAQVEPSELRRNTLADHARAVKLLRTVGAASLRREVRDAGGDSVTAEFLARYPLINHLEEHVDQLERSLA